MPAEYIIAALSAVFFVAAMLKLRRVPFGHPQVRAWLIVAVIFALVSLWRLAGR